MPLYTLPNALTPDFTNPRKQPTGAMRINTAHPVASALVAYFPLTQFYGGRDIVNGITAVFQSNAALDIVDGKQAVPCAGNGSTDCIHITSTILDDITGSGVARSWGFRTKVDSAFGDMICDKSTDNTFAGASFYLESYNSGPGDYLMRGGVNVSSTVDVPALNHGQWYDIVLTYDGTNISAYADGVLVAGPSAQTATGANTTPVKFFGNTNGSYAADANLEALWFANRALTSAEVALMYRHPFGTGETPLLIPENPIVYFVSGAGGAITGTGALATDAASVAGTGLIEKTATGALNADAATTTGAGLIEKTGTGALSSQAATVAGTGSVAGAITGTGAINSEAATMTGAGLIEKTASGALNADSATMTGTGSVAGAITGTGAINSEAATITGAGLIEKTASGALNADAATMTGTGAVGNVITGTGTLATQAATMTGAGLIEKTASGTLAADAATMTGAGVMARSGTGAVAAGPATMAGVAIVERTASGVLSAQAATLAGTGNVSDVAQNYETIQFSLNISRSKSFNLGISRNWP